MQGSLYRFPLDKRKVLPSVFVAVRVAAAQGDEDSGNAVCQRFRQQVGSCLLADLANFQVLATFEGGILYILRFLRKNHFLQSGFTFGHSAYYIRESIGRDEVRHINVEFSIGISTGFSAVHLDFCVRNIQYFQIGKFVTEMPEVLCIQFSGQCEVGDTVGFLFSHHGNQRTGLTHIIRLTHLGGGS